MTSTYEPGLYYMNRRGSEVRKLLGNPPPQAELFLDSQVLPEDRWAYQVIWTGDKGRQGKTFSCLAKSFKAWGSLLADQDWWERVEAGRVRYFAPFDLWLDEDADEVTIPSGDCDCGCGRELEQRAPASDLREFLWVPEDKGE